MLYIADFGTEYANLTIVGVTQLASDGTVVVARTEEGIVSLGKGVYRVELTPDANTVILQWDTGGDSPIYAIEETTSLSPGSIASFVWQHPLALTVAKFLGLK